jgi:hypothetical protein
MKVIIGSTIAISAMLAGCGGSDSGATGTTATQPTATAAQQLRANQKAAASSNPADYSAVVQQLYVAYFGRPADTGGLANFEAALVAANAPTDIQSLNAAYSTNPAIKSLIDSFGTSAESTALYGSGNTTQFVTAIFQNVLGRAPLQSGLNYWVNAINSGALTAGNASLAIMAGALANDSTQGVLDAQLITNRIAVAGDFTAAIATPGEVNGYAGSAAATTARTMLTSVTASTNVSAFAPTINTTLGTLVAATATSSTKGQVNLSVTDGPSDNFNHVWVTIASISFHTSATETWSAADATWQTVTLPSPVTVDLAQLNNGALNNLFAGMQLPNGTYRQIRLFFVGPDAPLTASSLAINDNESPPQSLQWNDQVEYTNSAGVVNEAALEMAYPMQGVQLIGTFAVTSGSSLNLAVDFDLDKIIVPFRHDGTEAFTMRGDLRYFDLNQSGAIAGQIDPTKLCPVGQPAVTCAYNLFVHAELLSSDGSRHVAARTTSINPATGQFVLYPVAVVDLNGNPLTYDVVIRGRNMDTLLVTGITPTSGATPGSGAIQMQSSVISPTIAATEYSAQFSSALQPLTSGWGIFQQTLPSGVPYEIRWGNTDPFAGLLFNPIKLEIAPLLVAAYNGGGTLNFSSVTPVEGLGGYNVATNDVVYYNLSTSTLITAPAAGVTTTSFVPPAPTLVSGVQNGTASGTITISGASSFDHATLVISHFASIVTSQDVSGALTAGGSFSVSSLPSGSVGTLAPGAYYYAYLRLWKAGTGKRATIVPIPGFIDMRTTNSVTGLTVNVAG